jgi:hypothetical protein
MRSASIKHDYTPEPEPRLLGEQQPSCDRVLAWLGADGGRLTWQISPAFMWLALQLASPIQELPRNPRGRRRRAA